MHSLRDTLKLAHRALSDAGIDHALIGGLSLGGYGVHRATMDVDLLIHGTEKEAARLALADHGFNRIAETEESVHFGGVGNLDLLLANREPSQAMLKRAGTPTVSGIKCLRPEDIIGLKIQAYVNDRKREHQDKADIEAVIEKCQDLNWDTIKHYADIFGEWEAIGHFRRKSEC